MSRTARRTTAERRTPTGVRHGQWMLLLVLALAMAACGQSADAEGAGQAADGEDAEELMRLDVILPTNSGGWIPYYVAVENGYFEEQGLDVPEAPVMGDSGKAAAAIVGGSGDVALGVVPDVLSLAATGTDVVMVSTITNIYTTDVVVGPRVQADPDDDLETKIRALEGMRIGVTGIGAGSEAFMKFLFSLVGLDATEDAEIIALGGDPTASIVALSEDRVDSIAHGIPIGQIAELQGAGRLYISPGRGDITEPSLDENVLFGVTYALRETVEDKTEELQAFVRAMEQAQAFIRDHTDQMADIYAEYQPNLAPDVVQELLPIVAAGMPDTAAIRADNPGQAEGYDNVTSLLVAGGILEQATVLPLEDLVEPTLYED